MAAVLAFGGLAFTVTPASAASLTTASLSLNDPRPSQTPVTYDFLASGVTLSSIKCIKLVFSTTATGTTLPTSMDTTGVTLDAATDFIPTPASWTVNDAVNGTIEITYGTGETPASASGRNIVLTGVVNGANANTTYFLKVTTFDNVDCATTPVDNATVSFVYTTGQNVSLSVDPTLSFAVAAVASAQGVNGATTTATSTTTTIPFGTVTTSANAIAAQDITVSTNAVNGYTVSLRYTAAPTNGGASIDDLAGAPNSLPVSFSAAGTEAFGYTTNDFTLGTGTAARFSANNWAAATTSNAEVAYSATAVSNQTTRVGYQVGIAGATPSGTYNTTVIYTATPVY